MASFELVLRPLRRSGLPAVFRTERSLADSFSWSAAGNVPRTVSSASHVDTNFAGILRQTRLARFAEQLKG